MDKNKILNIILLTILILVTTSCKRYNEKHRAFWDKNYLLKHPEINKLIDLYESGNICRELKTIRTDLLSHSDLSRDLKTKGYKCESKPMYFYSNGKDEIFLTKTGGSTIDRKDKDIINQEIWIKDHCVIRIKPSGFPGNRRSYPHVNKAIIIRPGFYNYGNEAFKITNNALAVPKGPGQEVGMIKCGSDSISYKQQIDDLMSELHPVLLSPSPGQFCDNN